MTPQQASKLRAMEIRRQRLPPAALWAEVARDPAWRAGVILGADGDTIAEAQAAYNDTMRMLVEGMWLPVEIMRDKMIETGVKCYRAALVAQTAGAAASAASFELLGEGMGRGVAATGAGIGDLLKNIMGGSPRDFMQDGELLILLLAAGLFLTPGGQAFAPAIGKGLEGLARVGL